MVETGLLDWAGVADRMSRAPGADRPALDGATGAPARGRRSPPNLVLDRPGRPRWIVDRDDLAPRKSRNTPYAGCELPGARRRDLPARRAPTVARREARHD